MLMKKTKKNDNARRLLISINVFGSAGPIRFVVKEEELVAAVIDTALKAYAREGRLPVLGGDIRTFALYCPLAGSDALRPWITIGSVGARNFMLCKKPQLEGSTPGNGGVNESEVVSRSRGGSWKAWFNKSLNLKISTH
ncbi:unnamed protein product [Lathyrus sativus]|nr:unnamed protein product [Lathyrus sativus]